LAHDLLLKVEARGAGAVGHGFDTAMIRATAAIKHGSADIEALAFSAIA
jgi:hypothetical protein